MNPKTTADALSERLKSEQGLKIILRYAPGSKPMASAVANRLRPPKGKRFDEHWQEDQKGLFVSFSVK